VAFVVHGPVASALLMHRTSFLLSVAAKEGLKMVEGLTLEETGRRVAFLDGLDYTCVRIFKQNR
jgi:hypothetical protein